MCTNLALWLRRWLTHDLCNTCASLQRLCRPVELRYQRICTLRPRGPYGSHTARLIGRFSRDMCKNSRSVLALLDLTPDSSSGGPQLLRAYFRSKRAKREVLELDPPPPTEPPYQASSTVRGPFFSIGRNVQMR